MPVLHAPELTTREVVNNINFRANGAKVEHGSEKIVDYAIDDSDNSLPIGYQVSDDKKPILAESSLVRKGYEVVFSPSVSKISRGGRELKLIPE